MSCDGFHGEPDRQDNKGKKLAIWMIVILVALCVGVAWQQFTREPAEVITTNTVEITEETILAAADGDQKAAEDMAIAFGITVDEAQQFAAQYKDQAAEMERLRERENSLGTWEDAVAKGKLLKEDPVDEDGDIARYYDVNGDDLADFQVYFRDGKPYVWRFADETGTPYG